MRVKFNHGYRGVLTKEKYYPTGAVVNLPKEMAEQLIKEGRAELYQKEKEADSA